MSPHFLVKYRFSYRLQFAQKYYNKKISYREQIALNIILPI